jgi:alkanesulfonate monooxygenase SsuD/methylene tetrahydromethanopterin reductase-like flavin-dependent oxidoreductase (luciferase family)
VGEHITDAAETVTSCVAFLASVAAQTKTIVLGTGTVNLPNTHPATVAAQIAMLDHMLQGRLIFGISPGGLVSDAEVFGNLEKNRNEMFVESINMILDIWASDPPYNLQGKHWSVTTEHTMIPEIGQGIIAKPYQKPHPPIVGTAVAPFSKGVTEMAKRGWTPISANFLLPKWVATHWPKYVDGRAAIGAMPKPAEWRVAKSIFVADDERTAQEYGHGAHGPYAFYFEQLMRKLVGAGRGNLFKSDPNLPDSAITLDRLLDELVITGTVDQVVEQLLAFHEQVGDFGTLLYSCHDWVDPRLSKRSMELMATEVMPRLNRALA